MTEYMTSAHDMRFDAAGWVQVVRPHRWELARAIADDSAEAIGIEPDALVDADMDVSDTDLKLTAVFTHKQDVSMQEIHDKLDAAPFTRTWALYDSVAPSKVLPCRFVGDAWGKLVEEHPEEVKRAFVEDTTHAMEAAPEDVEVLSVTADGHGMVLEYLVHGSDYDVFALQERSDAHPYPETWALYDGAGSSVKHFDGENWAHFAQTRREGLGDAFKHDTAVVTGVPKDAVEVDGLRVTEAGLDVDYLINADKAANAPSRPEMEEKVNAYDYPNLWELYDLTEAERQEANRERGVAAGAAAAPAAATAATAAAAAPAKASPKKSTTKKTVTKKAAAKKADAGKADAETPVVEKAAPKKAAARKAPAEKAVSDRAAPAEEAAAPAPAPVAAAAAPADEEKPQPVAAKENASGLPDGWEATSHQMGFDGEDWAYVLKTKKEQLNDAIKNDVAECLGTQPENVKDVEIHVDKQMLVDLSAEHPEELTAQEVDERLKECKLESVWGLYGDHPYDPNEKVTTNHSIGFEGEDWRYTVDKKHDAVLKAFKVGTGNALTVPESDIVNIEVEFSNDGIILTCNVHHSPLQDEQMIQEQLQAYPYNEMWTLYELKPLTPEE